MIEIDFEKVSRQIRLLRKEKEMSQEQLAEKVGVSPQAVSKWENCKALPETLVLPMLSKTLGCSIDNILMPQELYILSAAYTDGESEVDVTQLVNSLVINNELNVFVNEDVLHNSLPGERIKYLVIKFQNNEGVFFTYSKKGSNISLSSIQRGYEAGKGEFQYLFAAYGNENIHMDALTKLNHYEYFRSNTIYVNHETFPSPPSNDGEDFLSIVYLNDEGIQVVSCAEGESISINDVRNVLYRSRDGGVIVENVRSLRFGDKMDCSWAGALFAALERMGEKTSYEKVMGVSGACWRIAFTPVWDYSSVDALVVYDYATPGYKAYGYTPVCADRIEKKERHKERDRIIQSLRRGEPPIAINLRVAPEWGVITGYLGHGGELLCRTYYDDGVFEKEGSNPEFIIDMKQTKNYLYVDNWPFIILYFSERGDVPTDIDSFMNSLRTKVDSMQLQENRGYKMGYKAFEEWEKGLCDEAWYKASSDDDFLRRLSVNHFCMMSLLDARRSASVYLEEAMGFYEGEVRDMISQMCEVYKEITKKLSMLMDSIPPFDSVEKSNMRELWDEGMRKQQAYTLKEVGRLEKIGDDIAHKILEH